MNAPVSAQPLTERAKLAQIIRDAHAASLAFDACADAIERGGFGAELVAPIRCGAARVTGALESFAAAEGFALTPANDDPRELPDNVPAFIAGLEHLLKDGL